MNRRATAWACVVIVLLMAQSWSWADEPAGTTEAAPAGPTPLVGWLELEGMLNDAPPRMMMAGQHDPRPTLRRVVQGLRRVASDDRYIGVVISLDDAELAMSQIDEITHTLEAVRDAGKVVVVFAEKFSLREYLLACAADRIAMQHKGEVMMTGLGMEEIYLKGLFEKIGARADFLQVGKFKGADEQLMRSQPSEAWNQNIDALLDDLYAQVVTRISEARDMTNEEVESAIADSWSLSDEQLVERGLVDELVTRDMTDLTGVLFGDAFEWRDLIESGGKAHQPENPFAMFSLLFSPAAPSIRRESIALVHVAGPIVSGESDAGADAAGLFDAGMAGSRTIGRALADARDNDLIKGVVIRVDSPGGSALASEMIWQAIRELAEVKPVYVSIGALAASGGYYVACAADHIYVSPSSMIGSIGVVGGKVVFGQMYEKIGVTVTRRSRGPMGDIFNSVEPFTPDQRRVVEAGMVRIYQQFIDRVKVSRGELIEDVDAIAQGRLFTGRQAVANGMADAMGDIESALADMAEDLELESGKYDIVHLPQPLTFPEYLQSVFDRFGVRSPMLDMAGLASAVDPRLWREVAPIVRGLMLLRREAVLTLMPTPIVVR